MLKPQATATRGLINLDGIWRFALDSADNPTPWSQRLPGRLEAAVPASYNDLFVDRAIRDHIGWVWYQRDVEVPAGWAGERVVVRLDSATHEGRVYVDDVLVAEHVGGYTPFAADITDHVAPGERFRLTVGVSNVLTNETIPPGKVAVGMSGKESLTYLHDFYNYAGLARSVWLCSLPEVSVDDLTVVTRVDGATGLVDFSVELTAEAEVSVTLRDEAGEVVASAEGAAGTLHVDDVHLWQPGAAYLYELEVRAVQGGVTRDVYRVAVGVRTVEVKGAQFLINGEPFYFTGFGKHEDTAVRGKGHDDAYLVHDFQLIEWIGANSFRTSHYPYAEEVYDFADRHGIVVIDETAAVGLNNEVAAGLTGQQAPPTFSDEACNDASQAALAQHVRELIARDKNHPSVVMWCLTNETASLDPASRADFEPIVALAREIDPTRPMTYAAVMFANPDNDCLADLFDVICLNRYYGWYVTPGDLATAENFLERELRMWADKFGKPLMMTEYGADTMAGMHSVWDQPWSEEYQADLLATYHRVFDRIPEFVGEQVWNFADFQTSIGIHRVDGNKKGVFTRDRRPKSVARALRRRWTEIGTTKPVEG